VGGREKKKILKAAAAIELVHLFLLAHDDIIDRGKSRHGQKTLNVFFADEKIAGKDAEHFGNSMAIIGGDMLYAMANRIIAEAGFGGDIAAKVLANLQSVVATTIIGQSQDIAIAYEKNVTEEQVLSMYRNKTARYTFEGPLHMGAKLAGCNNRKVFKAFSAYAVPLGIAFQIQDDILGVFGDAKKIGKSNASDIEEGKQSLLVVKARERGNRRQKKILGDILGKKNIGRNEIEAFRNILKETGSLDYALETARKNFKKGRRAMEKAVILPNAKEFFFGLVDYLEKRNV
jgi:geranylgeranyl diphosphate synthase type I